VPPETEPNGGSSLSLHTRLISSLSAVAAAIVVPTFWERGSLIATAVTPIFVAIVSEALSRPAKVIKTAAPRVTRRTGTGAAVRAKTPTGVGARGDGPEQLPPRRDDPYGLYEDERPRRRLPVRVAVITGLIAAVIGAGVVTASELAIFGHQIGNRERSTGLLGGKSSEARETPTATPTATGTATPSETATETATPTSTESASPTPTPSASATPSATPPVAPLQETPTPAPSTEGTPVPTATP
jgi:hypothetical protein